MAIVPMSRRTPLKSMLDFAAEREREANSIGNVIDQITKPILGGMGVQTDETAPQPAVLRGPAPQAQPLGAFTGPPMAPTLAQETVSPEFMDRLFRQESGYNPNAVSPKGAVGTGQVLPSTAMDPGYGVPTIFDLADEQGIDYGARTRAEAERLLFNDDLNQQFSTLYASAMAGEFGGDPALTAAAYNAGPGAVSAYGGVPPYAETQNYVRALTGGGGDTNLGGGAGADRLDGMNVEDILARLYPEEAPEDARVQRRRDILAGVSQVFGALDQGLAPDVSNIRAQQEARKRQAVLDMRERERARAAASLVYAQTEDRDLAGAIATGAISYADVVSERERRRVEAEADKARVKQEQANGRLAGLVESMAPDLGIPTDMLPQVVEGIKAGDDPNTYFTLTEQAKLAEAAREADEAEAAAAEARTMALETLTASQDPVEQRAGRLMTLDPSLSLDAALTRASELLKPAEQFAPSEAVKTYNDSRAVAAARGPEALAEFDARFPTAADFDMAKSGKLGGVPSIVDALNADLMPKGLVVVPDPQDPTKPLMENGVIQTTEIEGGPAQQDRLAREQAAAEEQAKTDEASNKATLRAQKQEMDTANTMRLVEDVYDYSTGFTGGSIPGALRKVIADYFQASEAGQAQGQLAGVQVGIFVDQLAQMRETSPTGAAVGNVTEGEREALASKFGSLSVGGDPEVLRQNLRAIANAALDLRYGTPDKLRQAVEEGTLDPALAEQYGARYDVDGTADTGMVGKLGPVLPLGVTTVDETILTSPAEEEAAAAPESPALEAELGPNYLEQIKAPDFFDEGGTYDQLSEDAQKEIDRLLLGEE